MYYTKWKYPNGSMGCAYYKSGYTSLIIKDKYLGYIEVQCTFTYIKIKTKRRKK